MARKSQIGVVSVDSGTLMIGDPSYYTDNKWTDEDYTKYVSGPYEDGTSKIPHSNGRIGKGVLFATGLGDGTYPVIATYENIPGFGERITEVKIEFNWKKEENK